MFFERFDRTVYKCDLLSITPNIYVHSDWKRWKNIENAETEVIAEIMVQPTFQKNIYREIATGTLIPVYREECWGFHLCTTCIPTQPVFIIIRDIVEVTVIGFRSQPKLVAASIDEVKAYMEEHTAPNIDYNAQLEDIYSKLVTGHAHVLAVRKSFQNLETIYCYV